MYQSDGILVGFLSCKVMPAIFFWDLGKPGRRDLILQREQEGLYNPISLCREGYSSSPRRYRGTNKSQAALLGPYKLAQAGGTPVKQGEHGKPEMFNSDQEFTLHQPLPWLMC